MAGVAPGLHNFFKGIKISILDELDKAEKVATPGEFWEAVDQIKLECNIAGNEWTNESVLRVIADKLGFKK